MGFQLVERDIVSQFQRDFELSQGHMELMLEYASSPYHIEPVGFREFVQSPHYADAGDAVWPSVIEAGEEITSGLYVETVGTGSIGCAKTTLALWVQMYEVYRLLCLKNPHALFALDPRSEIEVVFQSLDKGTATDVIYQRFRNMVEAAPVFRDIFPFDPDLKSRLVWPERNLVVKPIKGDAGGAMGQNVIGGIIDEINYMAQVEKSKKTRGELYDQAVENYNSIKRRRESRFMASGGALPGMLFLTSSKRYAGEFTDRKIAEARHNKRIYVWDRTVWDVKPDPDFWPPEPGQDGADVPLIFASSEKFCVYMGTLTTKPYIVDSARPPTVTSENQRLFGYAPVEYLDAAKADLLGFLRDDMGVGTTAIHPFVAEPDKVAACFGTRPSIFTREVVNLDDMRVGILPDNIEKPEAPRFVHIDLSQTGASCGFAIGWVPEFVQVKRGGEIEVMPRINIDGRLEIVPPRAGEIEFSKVREIIYTLISLGMNIRWVTFDQFQSTDSRQILARKGLQTGLQSMDRTALPYEVAKQAYYDGRVSSPPHEKCLGEYTRLEKIEATSSRHGRIEHPMGGSKDVSDADGGVINGLSRRREVWVMHGVPLQSIPRHLQKQKLEGDEEDGRDDPRTRKR